MPAFCFFMRPMVASNLRADSDGASGGKFKNFECSTPFGTLTRAGVRKIAPRVPPSGGRTGDALSDG